MQLDEQQETAYRQNLTDAGCNHAITQECLDFMRDNDWASILKLLTKHREQLLGQIHGKQKQLDCLDYFLYRLKKETNKEK